MKGYGVFINGQMMAWCKTEPHAEIISNEIGGFEPRDIRPTEILEVTRVQDSLAINVPKDVDIIELTKAVSNLVPYEETVPKLPYEQLEVKTLATIGLKTLSDEDGSCKLENDEGYCMLLDDMLCTEPHPFHCAKRREYKRKLAAEKLFGRTYGAKQHIEASEGCNLVSSDGDCLLDLTACPDPVCDECGKYAQYKEETEQMDSQRESTLDTQAPWFPSLVMGTPTNTSEETIEDQNTVQYTKGLTREEWLMENPIRQYLHKHVGIGYIGLSNYLYGGVSPARLQKLAIGVADPTEVELTMLALEFHCTEDILKADWELWTSRKPEWV